MDALFAAMLRGELESMGREYSVKINEYEAVIGRTVENARELLIVDLDGDYASMSFPNGEVIGFSRFENELPNEIKNRCKLILHRPFLMDTLYHAVKSVSLGSDNISPSFSERPKKRIRLDPDSASVELDGKTIRLSENEMALLELLLDREGSPVSREELGSCLSSSGGNMGDVYICHLRSKLENGGSERFIYTVRGKGYMLKMNDKKS